MNRRRLEEELERDIQEHIDLETRENIWIAVCHRRRHAMRRCGNREYPRVKEDTRSVWGWIWLDQLAQDCRHGLRMLHRNPVFTTMSVLSLALGIGANTAIFSIFDGSF